MTSAAPVRPARLVRVPVAVGGIGLLWLLLLVALAWNHGSSLPRGTGESSVAIPDQWRGAVGLLEVSGDHLELTRLGATGEALMIWQPAPFDAAQRPVLTLRMEQFPFNYVLMLAWKREGADESSFTRLQVPRGREQSYLLSELREWTGRITELALYLYPQPQTSPRQKLNKAVVLHSLALEPDTWSGRIRALRTSWLGADPWEMMSPSSLGAYPDIEEGVRLTPLVFGLLVLALPVMGWALALVRWRQWLVLFGFGALTAALVIHLHWMATLAAQTTATGQLAEAKPSRAAQLYDAELVELVETVRMHLPPPPGARIFIASDARFFRLRAGWHLRPHNVLTFLPGEDIAGVDRIRAQDYLFVYRRPDLVEAAAEGHLIIAGTTLPVSIAYRDNRGALIRFESADIR